MEGAFITGAMASPQRNPRLAVYQFSPVRGAIQANWGKVKAAVESGAGEWADIVLLPELWATGPMKVGDRPLSGRTPELLSLLGALSDAFRVYIAGSLPEHETEHCDSGSGGRLYNTSYIVGPGGMVHAYRKIHLFEPMGEHEVFFPGSEPSVVWIPVAGGELGVGSAICFDLRFPELFRHIACVGADLVLVSALWPQVRRRHFEILLESRAIENQCIVAGANACGEVDGVKFGGGSKVLGPKGNVLAAAGDGEAMIRVELELDQTSAVRKEFLTARPPRNWWPQGRAKIVELANLRTISRRRRRFGQKMVFTNGCFDILHAGHISYLESARHAGDFLVVGLNSDNSVAGIKGPSRPVTPQSMRAEVLAGLAAVDYVVVFDEPTPARLIASLVPDVLVKGADWAEGEIVGADIVEKAGGKVVRIPFERAVSTTGIVERILRGRF
jgi:rfaE bifunctional protein nucleotidyltransferase chain/domain